MGPTAVKGHGREEAKEERRPNSDGDSLLSCQAHIKRKINSTLHSALCASRGGHSRARGGAKGKSTEGGVCSGKVELLYGYKEMPAYHPLQTSIE